MGKKLKKKSVSEARKVAFYKQTDTLGNIQKIIFPSTVQVGTNGDEFASSIIGSIQQTRQGLSYLVAGSNIAIVSGSNGQVTISATAGAEGSQGDAGANAKTVNLTANATIIQYDAAGANPSPSSITLTATSQEFTNGFFKFTGGGGSFSDEGSYSDGTGANSDTATFTVPSSFSSTPYDFRVGVAEAGQSELVFDTLSIGSTRIGDTGSAGQKGDTGDTGSNGSNGSNGSDGSDGANGSGVVVSLDPLSVLLTANSAGSVSDFTPSGATIKVHENGTAINVDTSLSSNSRFFVVSATGTNITAGGISQTNGQNSATIADASSITASTSTIAHVVRVKNSLGVTTDYTVTQTLAKAVAGTNGSDGADGTGSAVAIFSIDTSGGAVDLGVLNGANVVNSLSGQENVPFDNTVLENTNVATNSSGTITLAASSTYKVDTSVSYETKTGTGSDAGATYRIDLELSTNGGSSYSSIGSSSDFKFKNAGTGAEGQNQLAGIFFSASANNLIRVRLIKGGVSGVIGLIDANDVRLSIISIEKLS